MTLYKYILQQKKKHKKLWSILLDPDKINLEEIPEMIKKIQKTSADFILVGGSFLSQNIIPLLIRQIKEKCQKPIVLFPGGINQICQEADALLFLSLISGRNPEFLIGKHVESAPFLFNSKLEIIPTGYILIENGQMTAVEYVSQTKPIPRTKSDLALATAMAGQLLGLKMIYLEAGSGAKKPVPLKTIKNIADKISLPIIVGGGIKNKKQLKKAWDAGADLVVIGSAFEKDDFNL